MKHSLSIDPVLRSVARRVPLVGAIVLTSLGLLTNLWVYWIGTGKTSGTFSRGLEVIAALCWITVVSYLVVPECRKRCNRLAMVLPIEPRGLWLAHGLALLLALGLLLVLFGLAIGLGDWLVNRMTGQTAISVNQLVLALGAVASSSLLAVSLLQGRDVELRTLPARRLPAVLLVSTVAFGAALALGRFSPWLFLLPAAIGLALSYRTYLALPAALSLMPLEPAEPGRQRTVESVGVGEPAGRTGAWSVANTVHRVLHKGSLLRWASYPFVLGMGLVLAGVYSALSGGSDIRVLHLALTSYVLFAFFAGPMSQAHLVDAFPLPRRRLLAILVLPGLAALSAGYGIGRVIVVRAERTTEAIRWVEVKGQQRVAVPIAFCRIAGDGNVPPNEASWGESHEAWSVEIASFLPVAVYSPYSVSGTASPEFVALQISRAVEGIYGASIPPAVILERYLTVNPDGTWTPTADGLTIQSDYPELRRRSSGPSFPLLMVPVVVLYLLAVSLWLRTFRAQITPKSRRYAYGFILAGLLLLHLGAFVGGIFGPFDLDAAVGAAEILIRGLGAAPLTAAATWVIGSLLCFVAYRITAAEFARVEIGARQDDLWFPLLARREL